MRNILRLRVFIPLVYLFIIFFSYILYIIVWDSNDRWVTLRDAQQYIIKNNTPRNIVDSLVCLSKTDSSYTSFVNPQTKQIDHFNITESSSDTNDTWRIQINIKKYDIQFIFITTSIGGNKIDLSNYITKGKEHSTYSYKTNLSESLKIQRIFETEVLDKVCEYDKCTLFGLIVWYSNLFWEYQLLFILMYILLMCCSLAYTFYYSHKLRWMITVISFSLYLASFLLPFVQVLTCNEFRRFEYLYLISTLPPISVFSDAIFPITLIVHIVYLLSIGLYLKGIKIEFLLGSILLVLGMSISMLINDYWVPVSFKNIMLEDSNTTTYDAGYYLWLASFVVLFFGMLITNHLDKKKIKE